MDAVDCALVEYSEEIFTLIDYQQFSIEQKIQEEIKSININSTIETATRIDVLLGRIFANAALELIRKHNIESKNITAIGCHGQTILHHPDQPNATSLQIGDPNIISLMTGITTIADFRRMDMAAGGEGAPLTPIFHKYIFHDLTEDRVIINIGGMANITMLPSESSLPITGFDTGPGNVLMDEWTNLNLNQPMDKDGTWAASGTINNNLLTLLLADKYFKLYPPKSTGRDYFNLKWLQTKLHDFGGRLPAENIQATLAELTVRTVIDAIKNYFPQGKTLIVCGGGAHNSFLMKSLQKQAPDSKVSSTKDYDFNPDAIEAMTFAWLAQRRLANQTGNIPTVTGARHECILGAIYNARPNTGN
jgi:anhydro-N-acetylmuramic acid kinase